MKNIVLFIKNENSVKKKAALFEKWLYKKSHQVIRINNNQYLKKCPFKIVKNIFCVFVLGGDGTFISAVRWMKEKQLPIIGAKFGKVGFLSETTEKDLYIVAKSILNGNFTTQYRMRLSVKVFRKNKLIYTEATLNDVVINNGALARLTKIRTFINKKFLTDYRADGLIIATPTGSTAYSLAAGGPIVYPSLNGILITPICPFTLTNRPLILPEKAEIMIKLAEDSSNIILTFDGQIGIKIDQRDTIIIKKSRSPVSMITLPHQDYFDVLKAKLKWSGSRI